MVLVGCFIMNDLINEKSSMHNLRLDIFLMKLTVCKNVGSVCNVGRSRSRTRWWWWFSKGPLSEYFNLRPQIHVDRLVEGQIGIVCRLWISQVPWAARYCFHILNNALRDRVMLCWTLLTWKSPSQPSWREFVCTLPYQSGWSALTQQVRMRLTSCLFDLISRDVVWMLILTDLTE